MICGIDVGAHGAIAFLKDDGSLVDVHDMPSVVVKVGNGKRTRIAPGALSLLFETMAVSHAYVERVGAMPGQGVSSCFSFGEAFGIVEGVLSALLIPMTLVTPQTWKRFHRLPKEKGNSRILAMSLFPGNADLFQRAKDDGRAEAALIALYGLYVMTRRIAA